MAVVLNGKSGSALRRNRHLADLLRSSGVSADLFVARRGSQLPALVTRVLEQGYSTVVAGGGDGTISTVAAALAGTDRTMGVLPLGTLNHFARDLHVPLSLPEAITNLREGVAQRVDVAEVNGRVFINNSGLGIYPRLVREREGRRRAGMARGIAFFYGMIAALRRSPNLRVHVEAGGREFDWITPFVFVGNNRYELEGLRLGQRTSLHEGVLCLCVASPVSRWGLVRLAIRALFGGLREDRDFEVLTACELRIEARRGRVPISADGEVFLMNSPLHYRIRPGGLQVILPLPRE